MSPFILKIIINIIGFTTDFLLLLFLVFVAPFVVVFFLGGAHPQEMEVPRLGV